MAIEHQNGIKPRLNSLRLMLAMLVVTEGALALSGWQNNQSTDRSPSLVSTASLNLPPRTTLLLNGTSAVNIQELCQKLGFEGSARTSPSSFICQDFPARITAPVIPAEQPSAAPIPQIAKTEESFNKPVETPIIPQNITYEVKKGETFSEIIAKQFGNDEAYGKHFTESVLANADLLSEKGSSARKAITEITTHPDWTPRTSPETWQLFMDAAENINPGDQIQLR